MKIKLYKLLKYFQFVQSWNQSVFHKYLGESFDLQNLSEKVCMCVCVNICVCFGVSVNMCVCKKNGMGRKLICFEEPVNDKIVISTWPSDLITL